MCTCVERNAERGSNGRERARKSALKNWLDRISKGGGALFSTSTSSLSLSLSKIPTPNLSSGRHPDPGPHHGLRRQVVRLHHEDAADLAPPQGGRRSRQGRAEARPRVGVRRQRPGSDGGRDSEDQGARPPSARAAAERGEERGCDGEEHGRESGRGGLERDSFGGEVGRIVNKRNERKKVFFVSRPLSRFHSHLLPNGIHRCA